MKMGLMISHAGLSDGEFVAGLCSALEELEVNAIWVTDHVVRPTDYTSIYPYSETGKMRGDVVAEPFVTLAYIAGRTSKIELGTAVLILPQRNPILVAKQAAGVDSLSRGRLRLGIGVGWLREEFEVLGATFEGRGARTDEYIRLMQRLWTEEYPVHDGPEIRLLGYVDLQPKPFRPTGIPIVVGGHSAAAVRRTARLGSGFFPFGVDAKRLQTLFAQLQVELADVGRKLDEVELIVPWMPESGWIEQMRSTGVDQLVMNVAPTWSLSEIVDRLAGFKERLGRA
jgi:probable F420-dependent oxidoreductase